MALMDRLLRFGEGKLLKQLSNIAKQVNAIEDDFVAMSDEELRGQTAEFRSRYDRGEWRWCACIDPTSMRDRAERSGRTCHGCRRCSAQCDPVIRAV